MKLYIVVFLCGLYSSKGVDATAQEHYPYIGMMYDPQSQIPSPYHHVQHGDIVRPCNLHDLHCMRTFLASNSNCRIANGHVPDPFYVPYTAVDIISLNVTAVHMNYHITGLDAAKIVEFYWNKATGNVVIAFNVKNLGVDVPHFRALFRRKAMESIVLTDYATYTYPDTTFTTVLTNMPSLRLDQEQMYYYVGKGTNTYMLGPQFTGNKDPTVKGVLAAYQADLPRVSKQFFSAHNSLINGVYIQNNLCDFGVRSF